MAAAPVEPEYADELDMPIALTHPQREVIAKQFLGIVQANTNVVAVAHVEKIIGELLQQTLNEELLNLIITMTEGCQEVNFQELLLIVSSVLTRTASWGLLTTPHDGTIGVDSMIHQVVKKQKKIGFDLNIMVAGASGLGKTTVINSLFQGKVHRISCNPDAVAHPPPRTVQMHTVTHVISENNVNVKLSITDTPGFGDQVDNTDCWRPLVEFITGRFETYLEAELAVHRKRSADIRIHALLYFIAPTGHGLKSIDIEALQHLQNCVNIIPVIGKSDALTVTEREAFKKRILEELEFHKIKVFPDVRLDEDEEQVADSKKIRSLIPFAVVGANGTKVIDKVTKPGRETAYGFVDLTNPQHCDFAKLQTMLIMTHTEDLRDVTSTVHYENYRIRHLDANAATQ